jgi:hypothetical protein
MAERYTSLVGKRVEAEYRAGKAHLLATGMLMSDTGKSILLEEHSTSGGKKKTMRVEIPYSFVIRVIEAKLEPSRPIPVSPAPKKKRP